MHVERLRDSEKKWSPQLNGERGSRSAPRPRNLFREIAEGFRALRALRPKPPR
jgi:hypothetical protein